MPLRTFHGLEKHYSFSEAQVDANGDTFVVAACKYPDCGNMWECVTKDDGLHLGTVNALQSHADSHVRRPVMRRMR